MAKLQDMLQRLHNDTDNAEKWCTEDIVVYTTFVAFIEGHHGIEFDPVGKAQESAYKLGMEYHEHKRVKEPHMYIGCGCPHCRLVRIMEDSIREAKAVEYLAGCSRRMATAVESINKSAREAYKTIEVGFREIRAMNPNQEE